MSENDQKPIANEPKPPPKIPTDSIDPGQPPEPPKPRPEPSSGLLEYAEEIPVERRSQFRE